MIDLRHLKYFSVLADELHFGKAAEKLFITQPPLSRQIKQMENQLGVPLFNRNHKKVELTIYGNYLKTECERIFADMIQIEKNLQIMKANNKGVIKIGYVGAVMFSFFPVVFKHLKSKYPDIHFVLRELNNEKQIESLFNNTLDLGFVRGPINVEELKSITVEKGCYSVIVSKSNPKILKSNFKLNNMKDESFIQFSKECAPPVHKSIAAIFAKEGFDPIVVHETSQYNALLRLVESGFGYSIVPAKIQNGYDIGVKFYDLPEYGETAEISMIYNPKYETNLLTNVVNEICNHTER